MRAVGTPLSMDLGAGEVLLTLDLAFDPQLPAWRVARAVRDLELAIRRRWPRMRPIYLEPTAVPAAAAPLPPAPD